MFSYLKMYLITSLLYFLFFINYVILRETEQLLFLCNYFDYTFDLEKLILFYFLSVPFITYILSKSFINIFAILLSILMIIGVLPSVIIYAFSSDDSVIIFLLAHVYLVFLFTVFTRKEMVIDSTKINEYKNDIVIINLKFLQIIGILGFVFYMYLMIKYFNILNFRSISEVYIQRSLFQSLVSTWEGYPLIFSKTIATFSLLIIAINLRKWYWILPAIYIFLIDYSLAAHKASIFSAFFIIIYYFILNKLDLKKYFFIAIFFSIFFISLIMQYAIFFSTSWAQIIVSLYDRVFFVSAGLFARIFDFTHDNYFFYGGTGLLGKLFSGVDNGVAPTLEIGEYYFKEGVRANVNLIADGYLNFGFLGSFFQVFILWFFFNQRDNYIFQKSTTLLFPLVFIYAFLLTSLGLQTALLSGGMWLFILIIKFGFKIEQKGS